MFKKIKLYWKMATKGRKAVDEAVRQGKIAKEAYQSHSWKSTEFWTTTLTGVGAVLAQSAGLIPPPWGMYAATASAALYALSRGLAKHSDEFGGVKPGLATTEFWASLLAIVASVASAVQGAVPPEVASILAAVSAGALAISRGLAKGGVQHQP